METIEIDGKPYSGFVIDFNYSIESLDVNKHPSRTDLYIVPYETGVQRINLYHRNVLHKLNLIIDNLEQSTLHILVPKQDTIYQLYLFILLCSGSQPPTHLNVSFDQISARKLRAMVRLTDQGLSLSPPTLIDPLYQYAIEIGRHESQWFFKFLANDNLFPNKKMMNLPRVNFPTWNGSYSLGRDLDGKHIRSSAKSMVFYGSEVLCPSILHDGISNIIVLTREPDLWLNHKGMTAQVHDGYDIRVNVISMFKSHRAFVHELIAIWRGVVNADHRHLRTIISIIDEINSLEFTQELTLYDFINYDLEKETEFWVSTMRTSAQRATITDFSPIFNMRQYSDASDAIEELGDEKIHVIDVSDFTDIELESYTILLVLLRQLGIFGDKWIILPGNEHLRSLNIFHCILYFNKINTEKNWWYDHVDLIGIDSNLPLTDYFLQNNGISDPQDIILLSHNRFPTQMQVEETYYVMRGIADNIMEKLYPDILSVDRIEEQVAELLDEVPSDEIQERHVIDHSLFSYAILSLISSSTGALMIDEIESSLHIHITDELSNLISKNLILINDMKYACTIQGRKVISSIHAAIKPSPRVSELKQSSLLEYERITRLRLLIGEEDIGEVIQDMIILLRESSLFNSKNAMHRLIGIYNALRNSNPDMKEIVNAIHNSLLLMQNEAEKNMLNTIVQELENQEYEETEPQEELLEYTDEKSAEIHQLPDFLQVKTDDLTPIERINQIESGFKHKWIPEGVMPSVPPLLEINKLSQSSLQVYSRLLRINVNGVVPAYFIEEDVTELVQANLIEIIGNDIIVHRNEQALHLLKQVKKGKISVLASVKGSPTKLLNIPQPVNNQTENWLGNLGINGKITKILYDAGITSEQSILDLGKRYEARKKLMSISGIGEKTTRKLVDSVFGSDQALDKYDLLLRSAPDPRTYFELLITRVLLKDCDNLPTGENLILLLNRIGRRSSTDMTVFTANYSSIISTWETDKTSRGELMRILHEKVMIELAIFSPSESFRQAMKIEVDLINTIQS